MTAESPTAAVDTFVATARSVLAGDHRLPANRRTRCAAIMARVALEELIDGGFSGLGAGQPPRAKVSARVKLICLRALDERFQAKTASWAYGALSSACHHHAYELAPTTAEVRHLIDVIGELHVG